MPKKKPLWLRALKEREAATFIKKNSEEFPQKSFLPDPIEFGQRRKFANEQIAALIAAAMPFKNKQHQRLAELFLSMPPRDIANELGWDRNKVYLRIRALKRFVMDRQRREKAALINGRGKSAQLDTEPQYCATKQLKFTLGERERFAYQITRDETVFWVDDAGLKFPQAVQDVLNEIDEHSDAFEMLDVE